MTSCNSFVNFALAEQSNWLESDRREADMYGSSDKDSGGGGLTGGIVINIDRKREQREHRDYTSSNGGRDTTRDNSRDMNGKECVFCHRNNITY